MTSGDSPRDQLTVPSVSTAVRNTMVADQGTIIFDVTQNKLCFCKTKAAGAANWEIITSVQEA